MEKELEELSKLLTEKGIEHKINKNVITSEVQKRSGTGHKTVISLSIQRSGGKITGSVHLMHTSSGDKYGIDPIDAIDYFQKERMLIEALD